MTTRLVLLVVGWFGGWYLCWRVPLLGSSSRTPSGANPSSPPSVAVVIPARNEASSLPHLLESLAAQSLPPEQIVVVDDASDDDTGTLARDAARHLPSITVIDSAPLPPGWTGKSWACAQGVAATTAEVLVFFDADVRLAPDALATLVTAHDRVGLLSVQPFHRMQRAYEKFSAVFNLVSVMGIAMASPRRRPTQRGAFGPCLVTTRAAYEQVGGHELIRSEVAEDVALGDAYRESGLPVTVVGGGDLVTFRMYPDGPGQLVEGWTKNLASGARSIGVVRSALVAVWITAALTATISVTEQLGAGPVLPVWLAVVAYAAFAGQLFVQLRALGNFGRWPAAAYPVLIVAFAVVFFRSLWFTLVRHRVEWRGRSIPVPAPVGRARRAPG